MSFISLDWTADFRFIEEKPPFELFSSQGKEVIKKKIRPIMRHAIPLQNDPIKILKAEHHRTLLRLETIERTLQYLESHPEQMVPEPWANEQAQLYEDLSSLEQGVRRHFKNEEEVLFPILAKYIGKAQGAIEAMRDEHAHVQAILGDLRTKVSNIRTHGVKKKASKLRSVTRLAYEMIAFLRLHISKENQILFEICEAALSVEEKRAMVKKMKSM